jgi:hypothetical protein
MKETEIQDTPESTKMQIDLHIAEYNAITTRCTNFTYIQNVVLSLIVIWITAMIGFWIAHPDSYYISWGALLGAQAFGIIFAALVYEQYNMVRYIESYLRPIIIRFVKNDTIWFYESFLITQRKDAYKIWEFSSVIITGILIIVLAIIRIPWKLGDLLGFILNSLAVYMFTMKIYDGAKIRWNKWKID